MIMTYGRLLARRRPLLSLLTFLAAVLPIVATGTLWIVDSHAVASAEQRQRIAMGEARWSISAAGAQSPERLQRIDADLRAAKIGSNFGAAVVEFPVLVNGATRNVSAASQPWTGRFRSAITLLEGRAPRTPSEMAVTPALARQGLGIGARTGAGGKDRTVVGIATAPQRAGATESVFLDSPEELLHSSVPLMAQWSSEAKPRDALIARHELSVKSRSEIVGKRSMLTSHPVLLGGTISVTAGLLLLSIRLLMTRTAERTRRSMTVVGASGLHVAGMEIMVAVWPTVTGIAVGWVIFVVELWTLPDMVAAAHDIERPSPPIPWAGLVGLSVAAVLLAVLPIAATLVGRSKPAVSRAMRPGDPRTPVALAVRNALAHRRRSAHVAALAALPSIALIMMMAFVATVDAAESAQAKASGLPDNVVQIRTSAAELPQGLAKELRTRFGLVMSPVGSPMHKTRYVLATPQDPDQMCKPLTILKDVSGWQSATGRQITDAERTALEGGKGVAVDPGCGKRVAFVPEGETRPLPNALDLVFTTVDERTANQQGIFALQRTVSTLGLSTHIDVYMASRDRAMTAPEFETLLQCSCHSRWARPSATSRGRPVGCS